MNKILENFWEQVEKEKLNIKKEKNDKEKEIEAKNQEINNRIKEWIDYLPKALKDIFEDRLEIEQRENSFLIGSLGSITPQVIYVKKEDTTIPYDPEYGALYLSFPEAGLVVVTDRKDEFTNIDGALLNLANGIKRKLLKI
jgi:hypothetical protein